VREPRQKRLIRFTGVAPDDAAHRRVGFERGRIDGDRLPRQQLGLDESLLHPREDLAVRLEVDQATRARNRRMIGRRIVHAQPQKTADGQRVGRTPRDAAFRVDALEVAEQQQPKVAAGRQARPSHPLRVEAPALRLDEPIEVVGVEQRIQSGVERMARRLRQVSGDDPQRRLLTVSNAHCHAREFSTEDQFWLMIESTMATTGC